MEKLSPRKVVNQIVKSKYVRSWLRRDLIVLALYVVLLGIMTSPLRNHLASSLPSTGRDVFSAYWQNWWLREVFAGRDGLAVTSNLFYPGGLVATFIPRRWPGMLLWIPLAALFGDIAAYNFIGLIGLLIGAYGTFLLIHRLTGHDIAAFTGGAFFTFYPQHLIDAFAQPNTGSIQWLPWFLLLTVISLEQVAALPEDQRWLPGKTIGLLVGTSLVGVLSAFVNLKIWVLVAFVVGGYVLLVALRDGLWRRGVFWQAVAIIAVLNLLLVLPVLMPYFSSTWLDHAIEQTELRDGVDLLAYFTPAKGLNVFTPRIVGTYRHLEFADWQYRPFYLGMVTVGLVAVALIDTIRNKRGIWVWLVLCIVFLSLSLGTTLRINDKARWGIITPYALLENNAVFAALREPHRFALALLLPWSVLVGYGIEASLGWFEKRFKLPPAALAGIAGIVIGVMLFEIAQTPFGLWSFDGEEITAAYRFIDEYGEGAIVDVPMGRGYSKYYMALQTIHEQPIIEGMSARMPTDAYDYIEGNALTAAWGTTSKCRTARKT
ncbi:MAG: hypothetical protein JXJ17_07040 [Anaerolineae bacterium]|nr:hypothetical protein [Anaerolineae bacterium]